MDAGRFANFKSVSATFSLLNGDGKNPFSHVDFTKFSMDDLSEKSISPTDVIFLFDTKAVNGLGHGAALIGNEKDGWYYYSLNGTGGDTGRAYGDAVGADIGIRIGKLSLKDAIKAANTVNPEYKHDYDKSIRIETSKSEDKAMMQEAAKAAGVKKYILTSQDCLTVPMESFNKLLKMRGGLGPQTAHIPNAWGFFLPASIRMYNLYLPSDSKIKQKK